MEQKRASVSELAAVARELRAGVARGEGAPWIRDQIRPLLSGYEGAASIGRDHTHIWWRARKCSTADGYSTVQELLYPPNGSAATGRANLPRVPVLYASWNAVTALRESRAKPGDFFQIISTRVRPGIDFPCWVVGEAECVANSSGSLVNSTQLKEHYENQLSLPSGEALRFVDSFFAERFRDDRERDEAYRLTSVFADRILTVKMLGLMYPSVEAARSINLAVLGSVFDLMFEVISCHVVEVQDDYGFGVYELRKVKETAEIAPTGEFMWNSGRPIILKSPAALGWVHPDHRAAIPQIELTGKRL